MKRPTACLNENGRRAPFWERRAYLKCFNDELSYVRPGGYIRGLGRSGRCLLAHKKNTYGIRVFIASKHRPETRDGSAPSGRCLLALRNSFPTISGNSGKRVSDAERKWRYAVNLVSNRV
jgi:hypothetical protein